MLIIGNDSMSQVFKRYSQAKLNMMREALARLDRQANEHQETLSTDKLNCPSFAQFSWVYGCGR